MSPKQQWRQTRQGDYATVFDSLSESVIVENGPAARPWHRATDRRDFALLALEFTGAIGDFHQHGHCVYADDGVAINLIHETGLSAGGDVFHNMVVYVNRLRADGRVDRIGTVGLDVEQYETFWSRNPRMPSRDFS